MIGGHLETRVRDGAKRKGIALMAHVVCGYPSFDANREMLDEFARAGVDVVELQFPFSEPIADGPLFLEANQASLKAGTRVADCFALLREASRQPYSTLMMGYYNTVFRCGEKRFCDQLAEAGGRGMIIPDLSVEESGMLQEFCQPLNLDLIRLVAPNNTRERMEKILTGATGFVYAVARKGVTGLSTDFGDGMEEYFSFLKEHSPVPVAVGFGLATRADLDFLRGKADMAVIGTAVLKAYLAGGRQGVREFFVQLQYGN